MIQAGPDLYTLWQTSGAAWTLVFLLCFAVAWLVIILVRLKLTKQLTLHDTLDSRLDIHDGHFLVIEKKIDRLLDIILQSTGNPERPGDMIRRNDVMRLLEIVRVEIGHKCGAANCPVVPQVMTAIESFHRETVMAEDDAKRVRAETKELIQEIFNDNKAFHNTLGRELLLAAVNRREGREAHFKGKGND